MVCIPPRSESLQNMAVNNVYKGPLDIMKDHGCIAALNAHCYVCTRCFDCRAVIDAAQKEHGDCFLDPIFKQALTEIANIREKVTKWHFLNLPKSTDIILWKNRLSFIDDNVATAIAKLRTFTNSTSDPKTVLKDERGFHEKVAECFKAIMEVEEFVSTYEAGLRLKADDVADKRTQTDYVLPVSKFITNDFKQHLETTLTNRQQQVGLKLENDLRKRLLTELKQIGAQRSSAIIIENIPQSTALGCGFSLPIPTFDDMNVTRIDFQKHCDTTDTNIIEQHSKPWVEIIDEPISQITQYESQSSNEYDTTSDDILSEVHTPVLGQIHNMEEDDAMWETIYVARDSDEPEF